MGRRAHSILGSQVALYTIVVLSALMAFGYLSMKRVKPILFFGLVGFLIWQRTQNMFIVLSGAFVVTAFMESAGLLGPGGGALAREGFTEKEKKKEKSKKKKKSSKKLHMAKKQADAKSKTIEGLDPESSDTESDFSSDNEDEPNAASAGMDEEMSRGAQPKLDQAATLEKAYGNLSSVLGADGAKAMASDSQRLKESQDGIMQNLKMLGPMMNQAQKLLEGLNGLKSG